MNFQGILEFIHIALTALWLNRLRSALTALGIIIGVAAVIVMAAIGNGATLQMQKQISMLGTNVINVMAGSMRIGGRQLGFGGAVPLSEKDLRMLREGVPGIAAMSGQLNGSVTAVYGAANWSTQVNGVHADYFDVRPWALQAGRYFSADEVARGAKVAILGSSVQAQLFEGAASPVGDMVRVNNIPFEVIGTLSTRGQSGGNDPDDVIIVPLSTARSRLVGRGFATVPDTVGQLSIRVADGYDMTEIQGSITTLLRKQRRIKAGEEDNFSVRNFAQLVQARNEQQKTLSYLLATTAAMSLVVGGIGIMNIMLVSVTERTREIGIRMAIGANRRAILTQFLLEALVICILGGLAGVALGIGGAWAVSRAADMVVVITLGMVGLAFFFASAVGIFFGFYPAKKAASLRPVEALRYE